MRGSYVLRLETLDGRIAPGGLTGGVVGSSVGEVGVMALVDHPDGTPGSKLGVGSDGVASPAGRLCPGEEIPT